MKYISKAIVAGLNIGATITCYELGHGKAATAFLLVALFSSFSLMFQQK